MDKLLAAHWPHLIFVLIGVIVFLWFAYRPDRGEESRGPEPLVPVVPAAPSAVKRSVARRGLLALGPLVGGVATGGVLYGMDVGGSSLPGAVIWAHAGISALALLLVVYKVADLGAPRIRRAFTRERLADLVSVGLALVSVPLALTGVALLFAPGTGSFFAYTHLISSAWWTGLLTWHLRRYLGASLRAARGTGQDGAARPQGRRAERGPMSSTPSVTAHSSAATANGTPSPVVLASAPPPAAPAICPAAQAKLTNASA